MSQREMASLRVSKVSYDVSDRIYNLSFDFAKTKPTESEVQIDFDDPFFNPSKPIRAPPEHTYNS